MEKTKKGKDRDKDKGKDKDKGEGDDKGLTRKEKTAPQNHSRRRRCLRTAPES
jgi:hypothetical protein